MKIETTIKQRIINETIDYINNSNIQVGMTLEKYIDYHHYQNQYEYTIMFDTMCDELLGSGNYVYDTVSNLKKKHNFQNVKNYNNNKRLFLKINVKTNCAVCGKEMFVLDSELKDMEEEAIEDCGYFLIEDFDITCDKCYNEIKDMNYPIAFPHETPDEYCKRNAEEAFRRSVTSGRN